MNDIDIATAVNSLIPIGGGIVAVAEEKPKGVVKLPIGGLCSGEPVEEVWDQLRKLQKVWAGLGCAMKSPFMTMSLLALPVLPELRITDKGLVDTQTFKIVSLFVEESANP